MIKKITIRLAVCCLFLASLLVVSAANTEKILVGYPMNKMSESYECSENLWWDDYNENGVLDLSNSIEEVCITSDGKSISPEKFQYRSVIEEKPDATLYEMAGDLVSNPTEIKFLDNFYNIVAWRVSKYENESMVVYGTPKVEEAYIQVGETVVISGWEVTLEDTDIYACIVKLLIKGPDDKEPIEYYLDSHGFETTVTDPKSGKTVIMRSLPIITREVEGIELTAFVVQNIFIGASGTNMIYIYTLTDIGVIKDGSILSDDDLEALSEILGGIEGYNFDIGDDYEWRMNIEREDMDQDGKEEIVLSVDPKKIKQTPAPTTIAPTTPAVTTPSPTESTIPSEEGTNTLIYLGIGIVCLIAVLVVIMKSRMR
ncbi:MAG TPA: hypothetical protein ENI51_02860 [Candidatus Atribacteria bacterium]|nr:hypothetical protein [Candidatus Atribacteria bacterium]